MPSPKLVFVCKLEHGKWIIGIAQDEHHMLCTIGQWYVCKQHAVWLRDHPFIEITEKHSFYDDEMPNHHRKIAIEYMKRYGAENVQWGNEDTLPEQYYTLYPVPNPNMKYR